MRTLYPSFEPNRTVHLQADGLHSVYVEESGNPAGIPVVFLHGGPGSGCKPHHRQFFDPARYRVVIFDQRGCHRSSPQGEVRDNDTGRLLEDMERIREELGIGQWLVFGGSWGATLALAYAEHHPQRVLGLILRGSFLARQSDLDWFARDGASRIFPDHWDDFVGGIPAAEQGDLVAAYHRRVFGADPVGRQAAARAWSTWAGRVVTSSLPPPADDQARDEEDPQRVLNEVRIEAHYAFHRYFLRPNQLLDDIRRIPPVPVRLIHGRRDLTCTLEASWSLHRAIPGSRLSILPDSGHLASEPAMVDALVAATDELAGLIAGSAAQPAPV